MSRRSSSFVRLLLRAYPRQLRLREGEALEAACIECLARERVRLGRLGVAYGWGRLIAYTIAAAILLRVDERRRRSLAWHRSQPCPKEILMTRILQDVKYAARLLQRAPMFTFVVVATLALTIGATTAVFTVVNGVLLRALPSRDPARLVLLQQALGGTPAGFSPPGYLAFEARAGLFESIAAFRNRESELSGVEPPERVIVTRASATLFETLGVRPALGRAFTREDDDSARPVAVLSDALWTRKFARDPAAIGRAIVLDRQPFTIVGVMPNGFTFPLRGLLINNVPADVYVPSGSTPRERRGFGSMYANGVVARLKPGVTVTQANVDTRALVQSNARDMYPASLGGLAGIVSGPATALSEEVIGRSRTLLWVVFAAVSCVLLIACADIASLMLARAMAREREIAVRSALGAGRGRLIRQLLVESALLALIGNVLGLLLAVWLSRALVALTPSTLPRLHEIGVDARALLFTAALTVVTTLLCGLLPAVELSRTRGEALKEGGGRTSGGRRERRMFGALVAAQLAIAVVLLVGGGLLLRSFSKLMAVDAALPVTSVQTMSEIVQRSGAVPRFNTLLVSLFAVLALLLAAIGIAGMLAISVSRRLPELGIRMALGAQRQTMLAMVIRQGMFPAAAGLAVGLPSAWLVSRVFPACCSGSARAIR
jgi:putative ABC transport system permease protein